MVGSFGRFRKQQIQEEEEVKKAADIFRKMVKENCQLTGLNFRPSLELKLTHFNVEVFWHPFFMKLLMQYFEVCAFQS